MTALFGWCLDGRHAACREVIERAVDKGVDAPRAALLCGCPCHG